MLPTAAAMPAVSANAAERLALSRHERIALSAPERPSAALPARRMLSAATLATRSSGDQEANRATCRSGKESPQDRKSTRLNSSHGYISYAVFCLKKKKKIK